MSGTRLSALVVNYCSGAFAQRCVETLRREWRREGRADDDLEAIVVDNASPTDQEPWLSELEASGATVLRSATNDGYAGGIDRAFARSRGGPRDVVAILNPDLYFLPGSVGTMVEHLLANPDVGVVDPRAFVDHGLALHLPRNELPTIAEHARSIAAQVSPAAARAYGRRRLRRVVEWYEASEPIDADMLSGCCLFLRREVAESLPALLDDRYPLYYEDSDLFRTLRRRGYRLVHHTGALVLHHWSRSAGINEGFEAGPLQRYHASQRAYFRKFYGPLGSLAVGAANALARRWPPARSFRPMHDLADLGEREEPIALELPRRARFLIEIGMSPVFLLSAGVLGEGDRWRCEDASWEWFFQADYCARALDRDTGELLGAWRFRKSRPGRVGPLDLEALGHDALELSAFDARPARAEGVA